MEPYYETAFDEEAYLWNVYSKWGRSIAQIHRIDSPDKELPAFAKLPRGTAQFIASQIRDNLNVSYDLMVNKMKIAPLVHVRIFDETQQPADKNLLLTGDVKMCLYGDNECAAEDPWREISINEEDYYLFMFPIGFLPGVLYDIVTDMIDNKGTLSWVGEDNEY
jgi:hypothetical protein